MEDYPMPPIDTAMGRVSLRSRAALLCLDFVDPVPIYLVVVAALDRRKDGSYQTIQTVYLRYRMYALVDSRHVRTYSTVHVRSLEEKDGEPACAFANRKIFQPLLRDEK